VHGKPFCTKYVHSDAGQTKIVIGLCGSRCIGLAVALIIPAQLGRRAAHPHGSVLLALWFPERTRLDGG
jgi:hypothetical protein